MPPTKFNVDKHTLINACWKCLIQLKRNVMPATIFNFLLNQEHKDPKKNIDHCKELHMKRATPKFSSCSNAENPKDKISKKLKTRSNWRNCFPLYIVGANWSKAEKGKNSRVVKDLCTMCWSKWCTMCSLWWSK